MKACKRQAGVETSSGGTRVETPDRRENNRRWAGVKTSGSANTRQAWKHQAVGTSSSKNTRQLKHQAVKTPNTKQWKYQAGVGLSATLLPLQPGHVPTAIL